jgi:putative SOS response-associated peptidase YedK
LKLEAPLAVQGTPPLPGFFPVNKFSSAPLLMEAARVAQVRSGGDDVKKRLMIAPDVHVTRLVTGQRNGATVVTQVLLKQFGVEQSVSVPEDGVVIVALGTIESSRLALISFPNSAARAFRPVWTWRDSPLNSGVCYAARPIRNSLAHYYDVCVGTNSSHF